jgi:hypothetical protein
MSLLSSSTISALSPIERAQRMLAATADALVDFSTAFKTIVDDTPCQWRRGEGNVP